MVTLKDCVVGSEVTIKGRITGVDRNKHYAVSVRFDCQLEGRFDPSQFTSISPPPLKVGERVKDWSGDGRVIAIFQDWAWVKFDHANIPDRCALQSLTRLTEEVSQ